MVLGHALVAAEGRWKIGKGNFLLDAVPGVTTESRELEVVEWSRLHFPVCWLLAVSSVAAVRAVIS